jgi:hypothetical protein
MLPSQFGRRLVSGKSTKGNEGPRNQILQDYLGLRKASCTQNKDCTLAYRNMIQTT